MGFAADFVVWQEHYSVGVKAIDEQHKQALRVINSIYKSMGTGASARLEADLKRLRIFTATHFRYEEELLRIVEYPGLPAHMEQHRTMRERTESYISAFQRGDGDSLELLQLLKDWWINHINGEDRKYVPQVMGLEL